MSGKRIDVVFRDKDSVKGYSISIDKVKKSLKTAGAAMGLVVVMLVSGVMTTGDLQDAQEQQKMFEESQNRVVTEMEIEKAKEEESMNQEKTMSDAVEDANNEQEQYAEDFLNAVEEDNSQDEVPSRVGP